MADIIIKCRTAPVGPERRGSWVHCRIHKISRRACPDTLRERARTNGARIWCGGCAEGNEH